MNYRNVYRVLAVKDALNILIDIYEKCKIEEYMSFNDICKKYKKSEPSIRRITNRLSRSGLVKSIKNPNSENGRSRVYIVSDATLCDKLIDISQYISEC
jgi:predicted transcriptional regulator